MGQEGAAPRIDHASWSIYLRYMLRRRCGVRPDRFSAMLPLLGVQLGVQLVAVSGACVPAEAPPAATPAVAQRWITTWWVRAGKHNIT